MSRRRGRASKGEGSSSSSKKQKSNSDSESHKGSKSSSKSSKGKGRTSLRTAQKGLNVDQTEPTEVVKFVEFPEVRPPPPLLIEEAARLPVDGHYGFESWSAGQIDGLRSEMDHIERVVGALKGSVHAALKHLRSSAVKKRAHVSVLLPAEHVYNGGAAHARDVAPASPASKAPVTAGTGRSMMQGSRGGGSQAAQSSGGGSSRRSRGGAGDDEAFSEGDAEEEYDDDDDEYRAAVRDSAGESSAARRRKNKSSSKPKMGASLVSANPPPPPKNSFWHFMQPFFAPITDRHFQLMQPTVVDTKKDPDFQMPPLGKHYLDQWSQEDGVEYKRKRGGEGMYIGDNTQRLLAALVSENVNDAEMAPTGRKSKKHRLDKSAKRTRSSSKLSSSDNPVTCYNGELMKHIEQSVKQNLISLDLIQQQTPQNQEDDEICETIRRLQSELRDQIRQNNELKGSVLPLLRQRVTQQEQEQRAREAAAATLSQYKELMQKQIKERKN